MIHPHSPDDRVCRSLMRARLFSDRGGTTFRRSVLNRYDWREYARCRRVLSCTALDGERDAKQP